MMKQVLTILSSFCAALAGVFQWKRERTRRAIAEAVRSGDAEAVTKHHHDLLK